MTSQTYQADDDQLAPEHDDYLIAEDNPNEPDATLTEPHADPAEPDAADPAEPDAAEPDAGQTAHEDLPPDRAGPVALADREPATSMTPGDPDFTPDSDGADGAAEEPGMADSAPASPSLISEAFTVPETVTDSPHGGNTASANGPWNEIQAMFVDDPLASIARAAGLVDDRVEELIQSVRERQQSVQSAWQANSAGTEELRVALQHYRTFWNNLEDLPAPA